jgi:hypothetical protein
VALLQSVCPITRPAVLMHDSGNEDVILMCFVEYGEWKTSNETLADVPPLNRSCLWKLSNSID